jgi:hypothetical protein
MLKRLSRWWSSQRVTIKAAIIGAIVGGLIQVLGPALIQRVTPPPTVIVQAPIATPAAATPTLARVPQTPTPTSTSSQFPTATAHPYFPRTTSTSTSSPSVTLILTVTPALTPSVTYTPSAPMIPTSSPIPTATETPIPTSSPTPTTTGTLIPTSSPRPMPVETPIPTSSPTPTATETPIPTSSPTPTATETPISTSSPTATATGTPIPTSSPTPTPTSVQENVRFVLPVVINETCETLIQITNVGWAVTKAAIVLFCQPGMCAPQCNGPERVACTGPIIPGATWTFRVDRPLCAQSGLVYSVGNPSEDDGLCTKAWWGDLVGDCGDWRRFDRLYVNGNLMPSDRNDNGRRDVEDEFDTVLQPLAVSLTRRCLVGGTTVVDSTYTAIPESVGGMGVGSLGEHIYKAPLGFDLVSDGAVILYIQNAGNECTSVEISFQRRDDGSQVGDVLTIDYIEAGERQQVDSSIMPEPVSQLDAWIRATMPSGIVVDIVGGDTFESYSVLSQTPPE